MCGRSGWCCPRRGPCTWTSRTGSRSLRSCRGHKHGSKYREVFDLCLQAVESGDAVMPLSLATYAELMKWKSPRQRRHVCTAIELLTDGYKTILCEVVLGVLELDQALFDNGRRSS